MCFKNSSPSYTPPAPAPTVQTDDMNTRTGEDLAENRRKYKRGFESTILAGTNTSQKSILGG